MGIKWIEDGEQSGWLVGVAAGEERLFVARKHGGKEATQSLAKQYHQHRKAAIKAERGPGLLGRAAAWIRR